MFAQVATSVLALASVASAHFKLKYPEPRGDSFTSPASQWIYPCANVNSTAETNRTLWPLTGGAVALNQSHEFVYTFVNLGLGTAAVSFNISLTHELVNITGKGVACLPNLTLPSGLNITEGQNATIQVINVGHSGSSLYNCADITFSANAPAVDGAVCTNDTGVAVQIIHSTETSSAENTTQTPSAAAGAHSGSIVSTIIVGMGAVVMSYLL